VKGRAARNRAVHGDIVIVELVDGGDAALRAANDDNDEEEEALLPPGIRPPPGLDPASDDSSDEEELGGFRPVMATEQDEPVVTATAASSSSSVRRNANHGRRRDGMAAMAMVVFIAEPKGRRVIVCTLHPNTGTDKKPTALSRNSDEVLEGDNVLKAIPTDKRMPWILLQVNEVTKHVLKIPGKLDKYKLWPIEIIKWNETSHLPLGKLKGECLGRAGDLEAEERHALLEHELDSHDVDFEDDLIEEVDSIVEHADANFLEEAASPHRQDLRKKRIFTIDPATARDLDDAIHVDRVPGKNQVEIGVHIADVGHFLKLGGLADTEARRRTTSVYLVHRVLPMLPHALCNHLCSLNPNEPKLSFSAFFRLDMDTGELIRDPLPWFRKTVMCSCCRLNYDEVQEMLDGNPIDTPPVYGGYSWPEIEKDIHLLHDVCGKVRHGRLSGGALTITKAKMIFHTRESEDGTPTGYHLEEHSASHWIIEELMLLANRCVAEHLANSALEEVSVLRNHKQPDKKKAEVLEQMINSMGILGDSQWDASSASSIYRCCQAIHRKYGEMLGFCVEMMAMRAGMQQAEYFLYGGPEPENPHHFALNFDYYTHFTSPIRRYPDVMVHRVLAALLTEEDVSESYQERSEGEEQVAICNEKKTASRKAQEHLDRSMFCIYLRARKEWFYTIGTVLGMKEDTRTGNDLVTVYSSQLGREKKVLLCTEADLGKIELHGDMSSVDDKLLLPATWKFRGRAAVDLFWADPEKPEERHRQALQILSCVPVVIIPTNTVPIDWAMFFVSPFHRRYGAVKEEIPEEAAKGFEWTEPDEDEEAGVEVVAGGHGDA